MNLHPALIKEIAKRHYERTHAGIYLPRSKVFIAGLFGNEVRHADGSMEPMEWSDNIVVNEGLDHILNVLLRGTTQVNPWYVFMFEGNYTPLAADTAAGIAAASTETTAYDEATRVEYNEAAASSQSTTNSANKATFTINSTKTMYGAGLASASAKGATTGTLLCAARFSSSRAVVAADQILITYTITAADA